MHYLTQIRHLKENRLAYWMVIFLKMSKKEKHSSIIKIVEDDMMNIIKNSVVKYVLTIVIFAAAALLVAKSSVLREMLYLIFISFLIAYTLKPIEIKMVNAGVNKKVSAIIIIGILILLVVFYICSSYTIFI